MRIPSWLDPWWHLDFEVASTIPFDVATIALTPRTGRLRGRQTRDGIVLVRRGALMNGFVRALATIGSPVRVRIQRPPIVAAFFLFGFVFVVGGLLVELALSAAFDRSRLLQSVVYLAIGVFIWVVVIAANYTSARSEAPDLERLIRAALGVMA